MTRIFVYDNKEIQDPDPKMTLDDVQRTLTEFFPDLANAERTETTRGEDQVVEFRRKVGTKG